MKGNDRSSTKSVILKVQLFSTSVFYNSINEKRSDNNDDDGSIAAEALNYHIKTFP